MQTHKPSSIVQHLSATGDMSPEEFRRYGYEIVDWIAQYLAETGKHPILSPVTPGAIRGMLPPHPNPGPESMDAILDDFKRIILPGITHWNMPGFMAYFNACASGPSILGEFLTSTLNVNAMLWRTSPAATELEQVTLDWIRQMLGLPNPLFGTLYESSSSSGTITALVTAREVIPNLAIRALGMAGRPDIPRLRLYISQETHMSVEKAAIAIGIGQEGVRKIETDALFRMDTMALAHAVQEDLAAGWLPFAVVATVGTTSTGSIDPVAHIADICEQYGLWLHVDAAYGGSAAIDPTMRWVLNGCERADSLCINPYKWLFTTLDGSIFYTRRPADVKAAFSLLPDYLENAESLSDEVPNMMEYGLALGKRFRALKLWMVIRYFGQEGLASRIHMHCDLAQLLARRIEASPDFQLLAPVSFSLVCFRAHHTNAIDDEAQLEILNQRIIEHVNAEGHFFLSHTRIKKRFALRVAVGNLRITEANIDELWITLQAALATEQAVL